MRHRGKRVELLGLATSVVCACTTAQEVTTTETGAIQGVTVQGVAVPIEVVLHIAKPNWQGTVASQVDARVTGRQARAAGRPETIEGVMPAGGDARIRYRQEMWCEGGRLRLRYSITPTRDAETGPVLARLTLPIELLAGRSWAVSRGPESDVGQFPREFEEPYAFFRGSGFDWFAWPLSEGALLAVAPEWDGLSHCQVQDNRKFEGEEFEIQLYANTPKLLKQGETHAFGFSLAAVDRAGVAARRREEERRRKAALASMTSRGPASIDAVKPSAAAVPVYGKLELSVALRAEYSNPFDPDDVSLEGHFIGPDGREHVVPGFLYWGYSRDKAGPAERLTPTGEAGWRVRYCPVREGEHRYWLTLDDGDSRARTEPATFTATPSSHPGLVHVAQANPLYWELDNGEPYFAIGENVCWPGAGGTYDYDNYWRKLSDAGANYARLWIGPFDCFTLERTKRGDNDPAGLGRYDLANSWRLDYVIDEAEERGIRIMFCIDSFNSLRIKEPHATWARCPYSAENGGPCRTPEEFFTNAEAQSLFRRRLRYIVARWCYSPTILAWEFWNEVNIIEKYVSETSVPWHREMARYLRALDPFGHMITTSWAGVKGDPKVDALPEMDYIQSHQYGAHDAAAFMTRVCYEKAERFGKPHYFGEYGTDTRARRTRSDDRGIHLHNGLWSSVVAQACGTAMLWWWDNYVEPNDLYHHFTPVSEFAKGIPFNRTEFRRAVLRDIRYADPNRPARLETLHIEGERGSWQPAPFNQPNTFVVATDGKVRPSDRLTRVLHGTRNHPALHNPATFEVDYPDAGLFIVRVTGVSGHGGAKLKVYVDGGLKADRDFADPDDTDKTDTIENYNGDYAVPVPSGKHAVRVVNDGNDWLFLQYRLPAYRRRTDPGIQVYALQCDPGKADGLAAIVWLKNERYNWFNYVEGEELQAIAPSEFTLGGMPDTAYSIEWWDTYGGKVAAVREAVARGRTLTVSVDAFTKDLACKIRRVR